MNSFTAMTLEDKIEYLRRHPIFWSRLGFELETGGWEAHVKNAERHKTFFEKGILAHSSIIPIGWVAPNQFDYTDTDRYLELLFSTCPDIVFLPRIKLNVPKGWCEEHPDDVFVYGCGPRTREEIAAAIGTEVHGAHPDKPTDQIAQQSFFSQKWREDATEALRRFIDHVEKSKWASRIIGYHLAYGTCGETTQWGSWNPDPYHKGDYGINATKAFLEYASLRGEHYDCVPPIEKRFYIEKDGKQFRFQHGTPTLEDLFFHTEQDRQCVTYSEFVRDGCMETMEIFCKAAKELVPDKVIGVFYGYIVEPKKCANVQHTGYDRLLKSPYIDFVASPKGYVRVGATDPGFGQAVPNSVNRKKLWIDELDNRTHLCTVITYPEHDHPAKNFEQTRAVYWREFTKNVAHHQGYWWMDLGGGWLDSEEIQREVVLMNETSRELYLKKDVQKSVAEVLLVIDENTMHRMRPNVGLFGAVTHHIGSIIKESGVPIDFYRMADLEELDLSQYKMIVFLNAFYANAKKLQQILKKVPLHCQIVWNYAAGILEESDESYGLENVRRLTGFSIGEYPKHALSEYADSGFPILYVEEKDGVIPMERYSDGRIKTAKRCDADGRTVHLCAMPADFSVDFARSLLAGAGVHLYTPAYCTVHADNRFIYVLSERTQTVKLTLPQKLTFKNVFSNEVYKDQSELSFDMTEGTCIVLIIQNVE